MTAFIALVGIAIVGVGIWGVVRPAALIEFIDSIWKSPGAFSFAVVFRFVLGIALILAAPECRHPDIVRVIGAIAVVAAVALLAMGRERVNRFIAWWIEQAAGFVRGWAVVAIAFGAFMVYTAT